MMTLELRGKNAAALIRRSVWISAETALENATAEGLPNT
jgi:hypothetical protein